MDGSIWSPITFPLPTKWGFSETAKERETNVLSILKPRLMPPSYFERGADAVPAPVFPFSAADPEIRSGSYRPGSVEPRPFQAVKAAPHEGVQIEVYDGLKAREFECAALRSIRLPESVATWVSLAAAVELDARGGVRHVFLETPSGQVDIDRAIIRALYTGRGAPGGAVATGRVKVMFWRREGGNPAGTDRAA